jgi:hypothetical protein
MWLSARDSSVVMHGCGALRQLRCVEGHVFYSIHHIVVCERVPITDRSTLLGDLSYRVLAAEFTRLAELQAIAP